MGISLSVERRSHVSLYICVKTGIALLHHVDDGNITGTPEQLQKLGDTVLREWLELKISPARTPGTKCEILTKTKLRLKDAFITMPTPTPQACRKNNLPYRP
jgi:hypothetical protein